MAYPTAQRKRLLEHELTSTESKYKSVKRELIAALDSVKSERGSKNPSIRRQADAQYNDLLSKFHDQNQMFDELLLDLKSQVRSRAIFTKYCYILNCANYIHL